MARLLHDVEYRKVGTEVEIDGAVEFYESCAAAAELSEDDALGIKLLNAMVSRICDIHHACLLYTSPSPRDRR